uniref:BHLH domain-containing protein n=1 Tax=Leersia perrieri TaxID=77586 RepID=A0A0D9W4Z9_9ORYZ
MSQEGADLPRDIDESIDHVVTATANNPVRSIKIEKSLSCSSSDKPGEPNAGLKAASPMVIGMNTKINEEGKSIAIKREEVEGGGDGADISSGVGTCRNNRKAKSDMEHALHIWTERERRKKMKNMFSTLHALLPEISGKADKATIVGEAIGYIKTLEDVVQKLEALKMERMLAAQQSAAANANAGEGSSRSQPPHHASMPVPVDGLISNMCQQQQQQQAVAVAVAAGGGGSLPLGTATPSLKTWSAPSITMTMAGMDAFIYICLPRQGVSFTTVAFVLEKHQIDVVTFTISAEPEKTLISVNARLNEESLQSTKGLTPEAKYKLAVSELMTRLAE